MEQKNTPSVLQKGSFYDIIVYGMMIVAVVFIIIQTFSGEFTSLGFRVSLGAWILIAVSISDFVGPTMTHELDGYDSGQMTKYVFTCILDAVAYMCIYVFVVFIGNWSEWTHYMFLVAGLCVFVVRFMVNKSIGEPHTVEAAIPQSNQRERLNLQGRVRRETKKEEDNDIATFRSRVKKEDE